MPPTRSWFQPSPHGSARVRYLQWMKRGDADFASGGDIAAEADEHHHHHHHHHPGEDTVAAFFRRIAAGARAHDLGDDSLYLAEELLRLQRSADAAHGRPPASVTQELALGMLVLATMVSVRGGSTCLPLGPPLGLPATGAPLREVIEALMAAAGLHGESEATSDEMMARIATLVTSIVHAPTNATVNAPASAVTDAAVSAMADAVFGTSVLGRPGDYRPLIVSDEGVYHHRMWFCERELANHLHARLDEADVSAADPEATSQAALEQILARPAVVDGKPIHLSSEQVRAVRAAVDQRFTVISGGPGTGKTAIVVTMLRVLSALGIPADAVALAAPTGKAANRMWSSIRQGLDAVAERTESDRALMTAMAAGAEPQTLHRLLGYQPGADRWRHHGHNPLRAQVVIVDEASMIDLALMERLLRAVPPETRLVVLGDADQLPSVDAGAVLRDLVAASDMRAETGLSFAQKLTQSFRMDPKNPAGRAILTAAVAVNRGDAQGLSPTVQGQRSQLAWHGVELLHTGATESDDREAGASQTDDGDGDSDGDGGSSLAHVHAFIDYWYQTRIADRPDFARLANKDYTYGNGAWGPDDEDDLRQLFRIYDSTRLLTVTRQLATGAEALNQRLHRRILAAGSAERNPAFYPGEPVLMRRNDYERGLFNGDQGVVVRVRDIGGDSDGQRYRAVFPRGDGFAVFPIEGVRTYLELAFAITVHKSQGSELDEVALILPVEDVPLLTRELIYTGITRARRAVVIVGTQKLLATGIVRQSQRYSGLSQRLAAPGAEI